MVGKKIVLGDEPLMVVKFFCWVFIFILVSKNMLLKNVQEMSSLCRMHVEAVDLHADAWRVMKNHREMRREYPQLPRQPLQVQSNEIFYLRFFSWMDSSKASYLILKDFPNLASNSM
jgi:hypothetical protein